MPTPRLPKTNVKLATSASFYILREDAVSPNSILGFPTGNSVSLENVTQRMIPIFAITYFQESQERTTQGRYEVDGDVPGQALQVLEQPTERTLTLKRAVLYNSDFIQATGYENNLQNQNIPDGSILSQLQKPFIFIKKDTAPDGSVAMTLYRGSIFQRLTQTYDLKSDLAVIEDVSIRYASRQQFSV